MVIVFGANRIRNRNIRCQERYIQRIQSVDIKWVDSLNTIILDSAVVRKVSREEKLNAIRFTNELMTMILMALMVYKSPYLTHITEMFAI